MMRRERGCRSVEGLGDWGNSCSLCTSVGAAEVAGFLEVGDGLCIGEGGGAERGDERTSDTNGG